MTRPKKTMPPVKNRRVTIRLTEELYELLSKEAEASGRSITDNIRDRILSKTPVIKHEIVFNDPRILRAIGDLGKVGSNLNQIAHHLNGGGLVTSSLCDDIKACLVSLNRMSMEIDRLAGEYRGDC